MIPIADPPVLGWVCGTGAVRCGEHWAALHVWARSAGTAAGGGAKRSAASGPRCCFRRAAVKAFVLWVTPDAPPLRRLDHQGGAAIEAVLCRLVGSLGERVLRTLSGASMVSLAIAIGKCHFFAIEFSRQTDTVH